MSRHLLILGSVTRAESTELGQEGQFCRVRPVHLALRLRALRAHLPLLVA